MEIQGVLTIVALLLGPVIAVQTEKLIERTREAKRRRENIFKTLMSTRGRALLPAHVEALNRIDLEFSEKKFEKVITAWQAYHAQLSDPSVKDPKLEVIWGEKKNRLLTELLSEMGIALGLKYAKHEIERSFYTPQAYGTLDEENQKIRVNLIKVLTGQQNLLVTAPPPTTEQQKLLKLMLEQYEGKRPLHVRVVSDDEELLPK